MTTINTDVVTVTIKGISGEIEAKIDTGAHQTSLHAEDIRITEDQASVIFKLNDRVYHADLETSQDVSSSDGGTTTRPVIRSVVTIEGQEVDTLINLNDRGDMPQQMLIGQDVIRSAGLTLQLTDDSAPEEGGVEGKGQSEADPLAASAGEPGIDLSKPEGSTDLPSPSLNDGHIELVKQILKLQSSLNDVHRELYDLIALVNSQRK